MFIDRYPFRRAVALPVLLFLSACGGGSSDAGAPATVLASVQVSQSVDRSAVSVGDRVTWTMSASNKGPGATSGPITLVTTVPANISGISVTATGATCGPAVSTLTCTIAAGLAANASASVVLSATAAGVDKLASSVMASGPDAPACVAAAGCAATTTVTAAALPNVSVTASVDKASAIVGDKLTWSIKALNSGNASSAGVITLNTSLPVNISGATVTATGASCAAISGATLNCSIAAGLAPNASASVQISANAAAAGSLVTTVVPAGANASCATPAVCTTSTSVTAAAVANVLLSSTVDKATANLGDTISWTIQAINSGSAATTSAVTLSNTLPANISGVTVTPTGASCSISGSSVSCSVPAGLAAGASASVRIAAVASAAGNLVNTVTPGTGSSCASTAVCSSTTLVASGVVASTATRPQLDAATAAGLTPVKYLAQGGKSLPASSLPVDNWDPTAGVGDVSTFTAQFTVDAAGKSDASNFVTVQAAIDAAVALGNKVPPVFIRVQPGTYRETVCLPSSGTPAIRLYSLDSDASHTVIVFNNGNPTVDAAKTNGNKCNSSPANPIGTSGSATFAVNAADFQAKNLTFSNDYVKGSFAGSNQSAVALMTQGDKIVLENVRLLGHQDTFYMKSGNVDQVSRVYVKNSYIEGDVDFIFGRGTAVLDNCTIHTLNTGNGTGYVTAASTDYRNAYGFLITNSRFTAETGTPAGQIYLGRAWDEGVASLAAYGVTSPNGQVLIRNSVLGEHIRKADPWADSTATRPYSSVPAGALPANRLLEYGNTGPGNGN
ncbi:pectinesterase family protein [Janthinobacterium sp. Mn2066]|uniref:pectinesterase family protein n=1 Tax=Janthinobacterium sp. Mn2066 TaxID=3395264 RepID=UPI003BDEA62C